MTPENILQTIIARTRTRLREAPPCRDTLMAQVEATAPPPDAVASLTAEGIRIIAEVKRMSPSEGVISDGIDPAVQASAYADAGAAAISVLTEPEHFGGSLADLQSVSSAVRTPCLRKDFIVDDRQLMEARCHGASLALLIVAALGQPELVALVRAARRLGLTPLVEAHNADEIARAVDAGAPVIGVNNRDLRTFQVDLGTAASLRAAIPAGVIAVAESGIHGPDDVRLLHDAGYDVFLVGTALMRATSPGAALKQLMAGARP